MKKGVFILLLMLPPVLFAQSIADKIIGKWAAEDGKARFEISKAEGGYSAKIVWLAEPLDAGVNPKTDKRNPFKNLQARPVMGLVIFTGLHYSNGIWDGTEVYNPEKGGYAKLKIEMPNSNMLKVTGIKGIFSQTKIWTRL